jgi:hypothetical protein
MSTLKDILDIGLKYGPEASNFVAGQRRIKDQIKNQREEMFPEFQRKNLSASQQDLSNMANRDNSAFARGEEARGLADALDVSGSTKGGQRQLAKLLGASSTNQQKLSEAEARNRALLLQQAGANEASVMDYNRNLSDSGEMFGRQKKWTLDYLEDQRKRLKDNAIGSAFEMGSDISSLFPKNKSTEYEGGDDFGTTKEEILNNSIFPEYGSNAWPLDLEEIDMPADDPSALDEMFDVFNRGIDFNEGGAVVTPDGYDHDGVDILMTDRSNGQPLGTVESAEMIVNASDAKKGIALAKKNPKSPTSKWFLQLAKRFEREAKNRK